ncbi:MAG TPA: sigma-70 family RNA polymerase sigma factor [Planctomycetota bacterium]|nr:sigma-70 family RNA polymerase sigma factor [Planctomycetota bacterium]
MPVENPIDDSAPPKRQPGPLDQAGALRLLLANRSMLLGYINVIIGDPTLTEDVFQEVSIVVMEKYAAVEDLDGFRPWSRTIARFQSLKAVNKRRANPVILAGEVIDRLDQAWEEHDREDTRTSSVAALQRCIAKLTPRAQELVHLRYHEDLSGQHIAERLRKPLNTIYVAISRIHRTLADCVRSELARTGEVSGASGISGVRRAE